MRSRERPGELLQPGLGSDADGVHGGGEERLEAAVQCSVSFAYAGSGPARQSSVRNC